MKTKMPLSPQTFTEEDIAGMLQKIPPSPEYGTWMKILSAVFSHLPFSQGARVLNEWSPEKTEGEYFRKHQSRLKEIGIGTLVMLAKEHGWSGSRTKHHGRVIVHRQLTPTHRTPPPLWLQRIQQQQATTPATPPPPPTPAHQPAPEIDMEEARRIAGELLKMHEEGFIEGPDDPDARIYAKALRLFRASFTSEPVHPEDDGKIY